MAPTTAHLLTAEIVDGPIPVVRVSGELDLSTVAQMCRAIETAASRVASRPPRIVIDLSDVIFCDSTGLRALIGAVSEVKVLGGRTVLAVPPGGAVDRLLALSGLHEFLRVADSPEDALRRLGGG
jgi:anti-sigma B factor antagonist